MGQTFVEQRQRSKKLHITSVFGMILLSAALAGFAFVIAYALASLKGIERPGVVGQVWAGAAGIVTVTYILYRILDNVIGHPAPKPVKFETDSHPLTMQYVQEGTPYHEQWWETVPVSIEAMRRVAEIVIKTGEFSARALTPKKEKAISRTEYDRLEPWCIERGILNYVDANAPQQGVVVSRAGRQVFNHYLTDKDIVFGGSNHSPKEVKTS